MDRKQLHERILYPVVRVRAEKAGGSGVLVYSQEDPKEPGKYINIVLTCEHVVDSSIQLKDDWDSVLKRQAKKDFFEEVTVETFDYDNSRVVSANAGRGTILAYDKHHDVAALRLLNTRKLDWVAPIYPKAAIGDLRVFDSCWSSGCSLLHDPFAIEGRITSLRDIIEQKAYIMSSTNAIFGNSGGGLFHGAEGHLLGMVSRVTGIQVGFGVDIMTWMNYSTSPERLHEFITQQELRFLVDPTDNYYAALERREAKRKQAVRDILIEEQTAPQKKVECEGWRRVAERRDFVPERFLDPGGRGDSTQP